MKKFKQLGLIGCGMMGGSFALAAKRAGLVERIVGYNKSPNKTETAKRMGIIDDAAASILQAAMGSDLIVIAVPVAASAEIFKALQFGLSSSTLVLDVGSTKQNVIAAAEKTFGTLPSYFVPSHPIAGKERAGVAEADVDLYRNKRVILTPKSSTDPEALKLASNLWQALGMTVTTMDAQEHDRIFAAVSHLPHLLAFAFMNGLSAQAEGAKLLHMAGSGFKDFTRIAASDPEVWTDILMANRTEILKQSAAMRASLQQFEDAMSAQYAAPLKTLISGASATRSGWTINQKIAFEDV
jgi:prephenate dehydrogenase